MKYTSKILLLTLCVLLQTACSNQAAYTGESFSNDSPFKLKTQRDTTLACESVRRALLGQGYLIDLASSEEVKARKATRGEGEANSFIEMSAACVPDSNGSTIYASGVLSNYAMKMSSSSASVGVAAIGSISLPIGQSVDSLVKVSEQTIDDKDFYKRFFTAVETILSDIPVDAPIEDVAQDVTEPEAESASQPVSRPAIWPELFPEKGETAETTADPESASQPVSQQPTILPELFRVNTATVAAPESLPAQSTAPEVAPDYPTARIAPETYPAAPEVVTEAPPAPSEPVAPAEYSSQVEAEPVPRAVESDDASAPFTVQLTPATDAATDLDQAQPIAGSGATDDEEPMGINPEQERQEVPPEIAPTEIAPTAPAAETTATADASQLAPIRPAAVARKHLPAAVQKALDAAAEAPPSSAAPAPTPVVEELF